MSVKNNIGAASDRVMAALIAGLEIEFGRSAGEGLARRFLEAEEADFHWDARIDERWLGGFEGAWDQKLELDRVLIVGCLEGHWFVAAMIVDGEGEAQGMLSRRQFPTEKAARKTFGDVH